MRFIFSTLPETNIDFTPGKWMVGRFISFWGPAYFQGRLLLVWSVQYSSGMHLPGDSKLPFYPLFGGHLAFERVT